MITPYISRDDVSAALASLLHNTRKLAGLRYLLLVELRIHTPDMPNSDNLRDYAVRALLVDMIDAALSEARAMFGLAPIDVKAPLHAALRALDEAVKVGAHDLLAWSVLYYRYVRADLDLSVETLAHHMGVSTRTITRYNDDGVDELTIRLIDAEQAARQAQRARRLYAALPYSVPVRLFGRENLLHSTRDVLNSISPRHILVVGAVGVGKTVFVQEVLRGEIEDGRLDNLVWMDRPASAERVHNKVAEILREGGNVALGDYLQLYRVAVVLDGIDALAADLPSLDALLRDLSAALVVLINRARVPLESAVTYLTLPEIDDDDATRLVAEALRFSNDVGDASAVARDLMPRVGGNPLALRLAVGMWEQGIAWDALDRVLGARLFGSLDASEQDAWRALALFPRPALANELYALWKIDTDVLLRFERMGVVVINSHGYGLVGAARDYVRSLRPEPCLRLLERIHPPDGFEVVEHALETGFPGLSTRRAELLQAYWREGLRRGHWATWRAILEAYFAEADAPLADLRTAYGICLRRLSEWEHSERVFYNVVSDCGRSGQFAEQSRALVEWSVLSRYQGNYERARALVDQAKRYAQRVRDAALVETLAMQEAQLLIQQGRAGEAQALLGKQSSVSALALQSEAQLSLGNYDACRALAQLALETGGGDRATEASLYTIIGRSYEAQRDWESAHHALTEVVVLLERLDDTFALARAQTNLAAVLIPLRRCDDAATLLARAEAVQTRLGDRVGLSATRHNLLLLAGC